MSNNAKNAYKKSSMPLSKWNKKNIIERIKNIVENYDIPFDVSKLDKMTLKDIKDEYLKKDGYHHTSKFYNTTNFYKVDIEKILENKDNTQVNKTEKFASFEELQEAFKNDIEEAPEDYEISDLNEALKDLGITENKPLNMDTPIGDVVLIR